MKAIALVATLVFLTFLPMVIVRGQTTTIYACVGANGALRIVENSTSCVAGEQSLTWNVQGPTGPAGPQGPQGLKGDAGTQGVQGPKGDKGDTGPQGLPGAKGDKGDKGDIGPQGLQGLQGLQGIQGPQGEVGPAGAMGQPGPQGAVGVSGYEIVFGESAGNSDAHKVLTLNCPSGKRILGGGGHAFASLGDPNRDQAPIVIRHSEPYRFPDGWIIIADEFAPYSYVWIVRGFAICANVN